VLHYHPEDRNSADKVQINYDGPAAGGQTVNYVTRRASLNTFCARIEMHTFSWKVHFFWEVSGFNLSWNTDKTY
jgi:hypothetical protein